MPDATSSVEGLERKLSEAYERLLELGLPASATKPGLQRSGGYSRAAGYFADSYVSYRNSNRESVWLAARQETADSSPFLVLTRKRRGEGNSSPIASIDRLEASALPVAIECFLTIACLLAKSPGSWREGDDPKGELSEEE